MAIVVKIQDYVRPTVQPPC